jgi:hypothetical protein
VERELLGKEMRGVLITTLLQLTVAAGVAVQVQWVLQVLHLKQVTVAQVHLAVLVVQRSLMQAAAALVLITVQPLARAVQAAAVTDQTQQLVLLALQILAVAVAVVLMALMPQVAQAVQVWLLLVMLVHSVAQAVQLHRSVDTQSTHSHQAVHSQLN